MDDGLEFRVEESTVTAVRMRFPADREFVFELSYLKDSPSEGFEDVIEVRPGDAFPSLRGGHSSNNLPPYVYTATWVYD